MAKVIVSNSWKHHAYEAAYALQQAGHLKKLYSSFYDKVQKTPAQALLTSLLPESLKKK
ncbi:hypothetical protein [Chloroherpeton thalassium]|uniref:hypothetical protein n=1 Tax=Chloroherpeton thalassium TaxID=100716 RepID=UPI0002E244EA|nr:hypothetical protein [Chloroherpeton thalassium]